VEAELLNQSEQRKGMGAWQLSKLARSESRVDRLKQTHMQYALHTDPLSLRST